MKSVRKSVGNKELYSRNTEKLLRGHLLKQSLDTVIEDRIKKERESEREATKTDRVGLLFWINNNKYNINIINLVPCGFCNILHTVPSRFLFSYL